MTYLDSRWQNVPRALASQFYRRRDGSSLVPVYFNNEPRYSGEEIREANAFYLANYSYNTATPRAIAQYILKLRSDLQGDDPIRRTVAQWMFNTLLLTQRQYVTQYYPGTVYVGSKNGFDLGYRTEVNVTIRDFDTYIPDTIALVFVRHRDVTIQDIAPFRFDGTPITDFLLTIAPHIARILYPWLEETVSIPVRSDPRVSSVIVNTRDALQPCYADYEVLNYINTLENCWDQYHSSDIFDRDDRVGIGGVFRDLSDGDARMTVIFTLPDDTVRSYQMQRFLSSAAALAWFEEIDVPGRWRVDVFFNLVPIYTQSFFVN